MEPTSMCPIGPVIPGVPFNCVPLTRVAGLPFRHSRRSLNQGGQHEVGHCVPGPNLGRVPTSFRPRKRYRRSRSWALRPLRPVLAIAHT